MTIKVRRTPPFRVRLAKLPDGRWVAFPTDVRTFATWAGATPAEAFYGLLKVSGWNWTGTRWEKWL